MKIFTTITPVYKNLVNRWLVDSIDRVEPGQDVHIEVFPEINGNGDFGTPAFNDHNRQKARTIARWVERNAGDVIFICDSDIIFMRPFAKRVLAELADYDIAISPERLSGGYNIGQVAIRCSEKVSEFYENLANALTGDNWDQELVNSTLPDSSLRHKSLSPLFSNTLIWRELNPITRSRIYSYHANDSAPTDRHTSIEIKQKLIDNVLKFSGQSA